MKDKKFLDYVKKEKVDFNIIVAYGNILTKEIINIPDYLSINVHASLLPRWRGRHQFKELFCQMIKKQVYV